jgi:hypothetical protein
VRFVRIGAGDRPVFQERVAALERIATYPLGSDTFQIDHGRDYWAFFDRLGEIEYHAALDGEKVVAVAAGVLRTVPLSKNGKTVRTWYLCDAKVHPDYRGQRIPLRILRSAFLWNYLRCPHGYAISMDPPQGENRVVRLAGKWRWSPARPVGKLAIFSLDEEQARRAAPVVADHRGPVSYLSLLGVKDLVLGSTKNPLPLLHVQWGAAPAAVREPRAGHVHMVCAPVGDALERALTGLGLAPSARASIIAHRMKGCDWTFVRTSEI